MSHSVRVFFRFLWGMSM